MESNFESETWPERLSISENSARKTEEEKNVVLTWWTYWRQCLRWRGWCPSTMQPSSTFGVLLKAVEGLAPPVPADRWHSHSQCPFCCRSCYCSPTFPTHNPSSGSVLFLLVYLSFPLFFTRNLLFFPPFSSSTVACISEIAHTCENILYCVDKLICSNFSLPRRYQHVAALRCKNCFWPAHFPVNKINFLYVFTLSSIFFLFFLFFFASLSRWLRVTLLLLLVRVARREKKIPMPDI